MTQIDLHKRTASYIQDTLREILDMHQIPHRMNPLFQIGDYTLGTNGKMMRGSLLLHACLAVGGSPEDALYAAAGTEYGHLASLIHDDVIDKDEMRRGQPTVWSAYGTDLALLAGDLFIFEAYHSLSLCRHKVPAERIVRVLEVLSLACIELCFGQAREAQLAGNCSISIADYIEMIRLKTGSLFGAALESGAILGGGTEEQIAAVHTFGNHLGIAFQIVDDLLPYIVQDTTLLKPTASDVKNRRVTLPILLAMLDSSDTERQLLRSIFEDQGLMDEPQKARQMVQELLEGTGALQRTQVEARRYQQQAIEQLNCLPQNEGKAFLLEVARMAIDRER